jgi:hypothetical protein
MSEKDPAGLNTFGSLICLAAALLLLPGTLVARDQRGMYPMSLPADGTLDMVTRVDLKRSLHMAGENLLRSLDPKRHHLPNWNVWSGRDGTVSVSTIWPGHNLGRWWDAMTRLQDATGFPVPFKAEAAMKKNIFRFFDNSDHLCLAPFDMKGVRPRFDLHSLREGLLAMNALVRYRKSKQAAEKGHAMIESLLRLTRDDSSWILKKCEYARRVGLGKAKAEWSLNVGAPGNHGRLIEALVWYNGTTGDTLALRAADRFARYHLANATRPDGSLGKKPGNHTHSYFGTLRGLLLYGELTGQRKYIDTVAATYRKTVRDRVKKSGFISHDMDKDRMGEPTSPGDAAQLALWLAARHNYTEFFDDVERIVRARLIPCQITETPALKQPELAPLLLGAYGGMYTEAHAGKVATTDITAAVTHTLVDVYNHIVVPTGPGLKVNFHFDYQDQHVSIVSRRGKSATVTIVPKAKQNVLIRVPRWTPPKSIVLKVNDKPVDALMLGDYALVPKDVLPGKIELAYALPVSTEIEATNNVNYAITWRGDEVVGISPNSDFFPFYPTFFSPKLAKLMQEKEEKQLKFASEHPVLLKVAMDGGGKPTVGVLIEEIGTSAARDRFGEKNRALYFDGKKSRLRYKIPAFPTLNYTFSAWFRVDRFLRGYQNIVSSWCKVDDEPLRVLLTGNTLKGLVITSGVLYWTQGVPVKTGKWYHAVMVKQGRNVSLYLNGKPVQKIKVPRFFETAANDLGIGYNPHFKGSEHFQGTIDGIVLHTRPLTDREIRDLYRPQSKR